MSHPAHRDCVRCAILPLCHPCRRRYDWLLLEDSMTQRFEQQESRSP